MYFQEEEKEWKGKPSVNKYFEWWYKGPEKNRIDPRIPTDEDVKHAKHLEMIKEAVQKHQDITGNQNARLTIPQCQSTQYMWWVS